MSILQEIKKDKITVQRPISQKKGMKTSKGTPLVSHFKIHNLSANNPTLQGNKSKDKYKKKKKEGRSLPLAQEISAMKVMDDVVGIPRVVKVDKAKAVLDGNFAYVAIVLEESLDVSVGGISREMAQVYTSWHLNVSVCVFLVMREGESWKRGKRGMGR